MLLIFFFIPPAPTDIYTLSLHDALPISPLVTFGAEGTAKIGAWEFRPFEGRPTVKSEILTNHASHVLHLEIPEGVDRKSTRLNSSHVSISYAVFCLKKKKIKH